MRKKLADLVRVGLLAISGLAMLTAWVFVARPQWVDALDDSVVAAHTAVAESALARLQRPGAAPAEVVAGAEALLATLTGVRKGDRLAPSKRTALACLHRAQLADGRAEAAFATAQTWQAFDAYDLDAKVAAHDALRAVPGRDVEAAKAARELFAVAPDCQRFLLPHLRACLVSHDHAAVAQAFFAHLAAGGTPVGEPIDAGWALQRDDGDGFDPTRPEALEVRLADGQLTAAFAPPLLAKRLRLLFPPRAAARLENVRFVVATPVGTFAVALRDLARRTSNVLGLTGLRIDGDTIVLDGHDAPSLLWWLGPGAGLTSTWTLHADVVSATPGWLADVLRLEAVGVAGRALLASDAPADARARLRYRAARRAVLLASTVSVQVGDEAATAVPVIADGDDAGLFRVTFARRSHAAVRLVMPAIAGIDLHLRAPFAVESRRASRSTLQAADGVLRAAAPSADVVLELQAGDPDPIELVGRLR